MPPSLVRLANDLLPPALLRLWRRLRRPRYGFFGSYGSYAEAALAAGDDGYSDATMVEALVRTQRERAAAREPLALHDRWVQLQLGLAQALDGAPEDELRVLDFGGASGTHYFDVVRWRDQAGWPSARLRWHVCETPAMAAAAAPSLGSEELTFHGSLDELEQGSWDLVYVSGSLQYVPDALDTWARLAGLRHRWLVLNRTPFVPAEADLFAVQRVQVPGGRPARYPGRFLAEEPWLERITCTHDLIVRWSERAAGPYVQARRDVSYGGMLLRRR